MTTAEIEQMAYRISYGLKRGPELDELHQLAALAKRVPQLERELRLERGETMIVEEYRFPDRTNVPDGWDGYGLQRLWQEREALRRACKLAREWITERGCSSCTPASELYPREVCEACANLERAFAAVGVEVTADAG